MNLQILQFKLNNVLKANTEKKRKLSNRGSLEPSRLAHHKTSELIFSEPIPNTGKKYKCELLLDVSYSMYGEQLIRAVEVLQNLIRLFYGVIDFKITCFGNGSYPMSARQALSINVQKMKDILRKEGRHDCFEYQGNIFNRTVKLISKGNQEILINFDGPWDGLLNDSTWWVWAVWNALQNMDNENWERFIVLITDWEDNGFSQKGWDDTKEYIACGVSYDKFNTKNYRQFVEQYKSKWIEVLPIGIDWIFWLDNVYDNFISVRNASDIYEQVIQFIDSHFGE